MWQLIFDISKKLPPQSSKKEETHILGISRYESLVV